jgi:hypothetical protein
MVNAVQNTKLHKINHEIWSCQTTRKDLNKFLSAYGSVMMIAATHRRDQKRYYYHEVSQKDVKIEIHYTSLE